ncbi:oxidoreductase C-terminal domain-containing protein [Microbacterium sp. LRZ72]|uniref:oxidoreductase C-terminal domain-containing protein n=1 Tax=Microbacterium sp. LRZ72 TaxID=2942481 RepID=UPI0039B0EE7B
MVGDEAARRFSILRWNGDELTCVESINSRGYHLAARRLLAAGHSPRPSDVRAEGFDLRRIASEIPRPPASGAPIH